MPKRPVDEITLDLLPGPAGSAVGGWRAVSASARLDWARLLRFPRFLLHLSSRFRLSRPMAARPRRVRHCAAAGGCRLTAGRAPALPDQRKPTWSSLWWPPVPTELRKAPPSLLKIAVRSCWLFHRRGPQCWSSCQRWRLRSTRFLSCPQRSSATCRSILVHVGAVLLQARPSAHANTVEASLVS